MYLILYLYKQYLNGSLIYIIFKFNGNKCIMIKHYSYYLLFQLFKRSYLQTLYAAMFSSHPNYRNLNLRKQKSAKRNWWAEEANQQVVIGTRQNRETVWDKQIRSCRTQIGQGKVNTKIHRASKVHLDKNKNGLNRASKIPMTRRIQLETPNIYLCVYICIYLFECRYDWITGCNCKYVFRLIFA